MTDAAPVAAATPEPEALPAATPAPEAPNPPPSAPPSRTKSGDAFRSAADIKAWVRAEIDLAQCGLSEDERKARNP